MATNQIEMKVKFINENPDWYWYGLTSGSYLNLGQIYESDLYMDSLDYYNINGWFYPKSWFQIIEE